MKPSTSKGTIPQGPLHDQHKIMIILKASNLALQH